MLAPFWRPIAFVIGLAALGYSLRGVGRLAGVVAGVMASRRRLREMMEEDID